MSMLTPTWMLTSISMTAGGGVCGKGAGIAHATMIRIGGTFKLSRSFMPIYRLVGGMTTGIIVGKDNNGTTSEYLTTNFNRIGNHGKQTVIGRSNKPGVSRA